MFDVKDRVAVITGGAHGIGLRYGQALVDAGARVVLADIDGDAAAAAAQEIDATAEWAIGRTVDVSNEDSVAALHRGIPWEVDVLVNNAAIFSQIPVNRGTFIDLTVDEFDRTMAVNLKGTWLMCREFAPAMRQRGYGKIINVSSGTAFKGTPSMSHYVASKAAVVALTKSIARTIGADNVCVNCIAPGSTLSEKAPTEDIRRMREKAAADRAIKRVQTPEDLVGAMLFLASPASDFITGQTLIVDGGSYMQ